MVGRVTFLQGVVANVLVHHDRKVYDHCNSTCHSTYQKQSPEAIKLEAVRLKLARLGAAQTSSGKPLVMNSLEIAIF